MFTSNGDATEKTIDGAEALDVYVSGLTFDSNEVVLRPLLPVTSLDIMTQRQEIFLQSIEFAGYDTHPLKIPSKIIDDESDEDEDENEDFKEPANEIFLGNMLSTT